MNGALEHLPEFAAAHLRLSLISLLIGASLSIPLGVFVSSRPRLQAWALSAASVAQTVPSLALLALMVPLLAWLSTWTEPALGVRLQSIGPLPALVALTAYSVLPILRNTVTGIAGIDPSLIEAAQGVGMSDRQRLWRVELPLAMPVIVAGLRTATVWVVGGATLGTPVGATSLGNLIFSGLQTRNFGAVLVGSVASAALALALDGVVRNLELGLLRRQRLRVWAMAALLGGLLVFSLAAWWPRSAVRVPVVVGAKTFTEQYILSELIAAQIQRETGRESRVLSSLGSSVVFDALRAGEIDVYVDYSGTLWATVLKREGVPPAREVVLAEVREELARNFGIVLVASLGFENTYALAMRDAHAARLGVASISDLVGPARGLAIGGDYEFFARPEWRALEMRYGLAFAEQRSMDSSLMYPGVVAGEVDVISAYSTDGRIEAFELRVLRDDLAVIPPYDAVLLANAESLARSPDLARALSCLENRLDAAAMRRLNFEVDEEGASPADVARRFLEESEGLCAR